MRRTGERVAAAGMASMAFFAGGCSSRSTNPSRPAESTSAPYPGAAGSTTYNFPSESYCSSTLDSIILDAAQDTNTTTARGAKNASDTCVNVYKLGTRTPGKIIGSIAAGSSFVVECNLVSELRVSTLGGVAGYINLDLNAIDEMYASDNSDITAGCS